ncbi:D-alanyl-D-alanine carboxypeptidase family protein, partial [Vibrio breoganii]|uniref:D-alanyl-D-alanine carboxypeptidase family protein n=1 Tax=Vibrio breoganii TaxID=553239 RepID=UPI0039AEEB50
MIKSNKLVKSIFATSVALSATIATSSFAAPIVVPDAPQIAAKGFFVLMDYHSGKVLAEKEMNTQLSPARLTKMMTSYVIGQELDRGNINLNDDVVISENAWAKNFPDSSKMFVEVGTTVKVEELNRGIII